MKRRTIAKGVYEDAYGYEVRWRDGRPQSKRFPPDAPLGELKAFRARMQRQAGDRRRVEGDGSFVRDVARFLRTRRGRPCFKSDRAHLRAWTKLFRRQSRFAVTSADIQKAVNGWAARYSPREIRHRVKLLQQLFRHVDPGYPTPCAGVKLPKIVKRKPRPVADAILNGVALRLRHQEEIGRLRTAKTRARYLLLALTGVRPAQLQRARPDDLDLARGVWYVDPAKGDEGTVIALNDGIRAAWALFIAAQAWGAYDGRSFSKTLKRNGWPAGVRPYQLRHTVGQRLKELDVGLGDIQEYMGHSSPVTTEQAYLGPSLARMRAVSARLDAWIDPLALTASTRVGKRRLPSRTATRRAARKATPLHFVPVSAQPPVRAKGRRRRRPTTKIA